MRTKYEHHRSDLTPLDRSRLSPQGCLVCRLDQRQVEFSSPSDVLPLTRSKAPVRSPAPLDRRRSARRAVQPRLGLSDNASHRPAGPTIRLDEAPGIATSDLLFSPARGLGDPWWAGGHVARTGSAKLPRHPNRCALPGVADEPVTECRRLMCGVIQTAWTRELRSADGGLDR